MEVYTERDLARLPAFSTEARPAEPRPKPTSTRSATSARPAIHHGIGTVDNAAEDCAKSAHACRGEQRSEARLRPSFSRMLSISNHSVHRELCSAKGSRRAPQTWQKRAPSANSAPQFAQHAAEKAESTPARGVCAGRQKSCDTSRARSAIDGASRHCPINTASKVPFAARRNTLVFRRFSPERGRSTEEAMRAEFTTVRRKFQHQATRSSGRERLEHLPENRERFTPARLG